MSERDAELSKQSAVINEGLDEILNTTGDSETKLSFNEEGKGVDEAKSETYGIESVTIITTSTSVVAASNENELFNEKMRYHNCYIYFGIFIEINPKGRWIKLRRTRIPYYKHCWTSKKRPKNEYQK